MERCVQYHKKEFDLLAACPTTDATKSRTIRLEQKNDPSLPRQFSCPFHRLSRTKSGRCGFPCRRRPTGSGTRARAAETSRGEGNVVVVFCWRLQLLSSSIGASGRIFDWQAARVGFEKKPCFFVEEKNLFFFVEEKKQILQKYMSAPPPPTTLQVA